MDSKWIEVTSYWDDVMSPFKPPHVIWEWPTSHGWMPLMSHGPHAFIDVKLLHAESQESKQKIVA